MAFIDGTPLDDRLIGTIGRDFIFGLEGNDLLDGRNGNDLLIGGRGNDQLFGGLGDDTLRDADPQAGGGGNDRFDGGPGNDILDGGIGRDVLIGGAGDDVLIGGGGARFFGNEGDDHMTATVDPFGGTDSVRMEGHAGNDVMTLTGGPGTLSGDFGDDRIIVQELGFGSVSLLFGGHGNDELLMFGDVNVFGNIYGGPGDDTIFLRADDGDVFGGPGDDVIRGEFETGFVFGGDGNDQMSVTDGGFLFGGPGNDILVQIGILGGPHINPHLEGAPGDDLLRGAEGALASKLSFAFSLNDHGADRVENFIAGEHVIQINDTGLAFGDFDSNGNARLDGGDDAVSAAGGDMTIDIAAAAGFGFVNTVTVVDTLTIAAADVVIT